MLRRIDTQELVFAPYVFNDIQYASNFYQCFSTAELTALGLELDPEPSGDELPALPLSLSETQFMQELQARGLITWDEADAYCARGEIPAVFETGFNQITDDDERRRARNKFIGATSFDRYNPETIKIGQLLGYSDAQLDDIWLQGSRR